MNNPFDLTGTDFLAFYIILGLGVNLLLKQLFMKVESCFPAASHDCADPYELAALRGGASETMRIALFSLIDRGLLKASDTTVTAEPQAKGMLDKPVERAVVTYFLTPRPVQGYLADNGVMDEGKTFCRKLADEGLLSDSSIYLWRLVPALAALVLLTWFPFDTWVQEGAGLLAWTVAIFVCWIIFTWSRRLTGAGEKVLQRALLRFALLKYDVRPGGETNSASILAALFGIAALRSDHFPYVKTLFPGEFTSSEASGSDGGCGG